MKFHSMLAALVLVLELTGARGQGALLGVQAAVQGKGDAGAVSASATPALVTQGPDGLRLVITGRDVESATTYRLRAHVESTDPAVTAKIEHVSFVVATEMFRDELTGDASGPVARDATGRYPYTTVRGTSGSPGGRERLRATVQLTRFAVGGRSFLPRTVVLTSEELRPASRPAPALSGRSFAIAHTHSTFAPGGLEHPAFQVAIKDDAATSPAVRVWYRAVDPTGATTPAKREGGANSFQVELTSPARAAYQVWVARADGTVSTTILVLDPAPIMLAAKAH